MQLISVHKSNSVDTTNKMSSGDTSVTSDYNNILKLNVPSGLTDNHNMDAEIINENGNCDQDNDKNVAANELLDYIESIKNDNRNNSVIENADGSKDEGTATEAVALERCEDVSEAVALERCEDVDMDETLLLDNNSTEELKSTTSDGSSSNEKSIDTCAKSNDDTVNSRNPESVDKIASENDLMIPESAKRTKKEVVKDEKCSNNQEFIDERPAKKIKLDVSEELSNSKEDAILLEEIDNITMDNSENDSVFSKNNVPDCLEKESVVIENDNRDSSTENNGNLSSDILSNGENHKSSAMIETLLEKNDCFTENTNLRIEEPQKSPLNEEDTNILKDCDKVEPENDICGETEPISELNDVVSNNSHGASKTLQSEPSNSIMDENLTNSRLESENQENEISQNKPISELNEKAVEEDGSNESQLHNSENINQVNEEQQQSPRNQLVANIVEESVKTEPENNICEEIEPIIEPNESSLENSHPANEEIKSETNNDTLDETINHSNSEVNEQESVVGQIENSDAENITLKTEPNNDDLDESSNSRSESEIERSTTSQIENIDEANIAPKAEPNNDSLDQSSNNSISESEMQEIDQNESTTKNLPTDTPDAAVLKENTNKENECDSLKMKQSAELSHDTTKSPIEQSNKTSDVTTQQNEIGMEQGTDLIANNSTTSLSANKDNNEVLLEKDTNKTLEQDSNNITPNPCNDLVMDIDSDVDVIPAEENQIDKPTEKSKNVKKTNDQPNTLNISDDEEPGPSVKRKTRTKDVVSLTDDDDVMLVDENRTVVNNEETSNIANSQIPSSEISQPSSEKVSEAPQKTDKDTPSTSQDAVTSVDIEAVEDDFECDRKPLLKKHFITQLKARLIDMSREDLEDFCLLKMVESVVEKSGLADISSRIHTLEQSAEVWRKKALVLAKQNRDLQIVLRTVQDEHRSRLKEVVQPLKITRSVGLQVLMLDSQKQLQTGSGKVRPRAPQELTEPPPQHWEPPTTPTKPPPPKPKPVSNNIPVPRLVPANTSSPVKIAPRPPEPAKEAKTPEKRSSVCIDLTDDEPNAKKASLAQVKASPTQVKAIPIQARTSPSQIAYQAVRVQQAIKKPVTMPIRPANIPNTIRHPIAPNIPRPGQTIMFRAVGPQGLPVRQGIQIRAPFQQIPRTQTIRTLRHPAPLPIAPKTTVFSTKPLPPAPELKITKVENGIVISWIMEGYNNTKYEEIASYQLYAYQETSAPPNTLLWKKIGDVKALPLPMACTLTQFMAGYKYYFAVRAVDVLSRLGPFSLPGSILLLQK